MKLNTLLFIEKLARAQQLLARLSQRRFAGWRAQPGSAIVERVTLAMKRTMVVADDWQRIADECRNRYDAKHGDERWPSWDHRAPTRSDHGRPPPHAAPARS